MNENLNLYLILNINQNATHEEILTAYRKKSYDSHPDKNENSHREMQLVNLAREILLNPWKRKIYDIAGLKAAQEGKLDQKYAEEHFFETLVNGSDEEQCGDVCIKIAISLKELYSEDYKEVTYWATRECKDCLPDYKKSNLVACNICNGRGFINTSATAPSMNVIEDTCTRCNGLGLVVNRSCQICNGSAVYQAEVHKNIYYDGLKNDKIVVAEEGHHHPGKKPGNLCVFVELLPDERFTKYENDIVTYLDISILEALVGVNRAFIHIDESSFIIKTEGSVEDGEHKEYGGLGFKVKGGNNSRGNLVVIFRVHFSIELLENAEAMSVLRSCLPGPPCIEIPPHAKRIRIEDFTI